jgi:hypothetical protein
VIGTYPLLSLTTLPLLFPSKQDSFGSSGVPRLAPLHIKRQ